MDLKMLPGSRIIRKCLLCLAMASLSLRVHSQQLGVDDTPRITLHGNTHPFVQVAVDEGPVADSQQVRRIILLLHRDSAREADLRRFLEDQQRPDAPDYHHWLSPEEFGQRFGASDATIAAVNAWLTDHGFSVERIANGKSQIEITGTAGQIRNAFATEIHKYLYEGEEHWANAGDPSIPLEFANIIDGFASLNNFQSRALVKDSSVQRPQHQWSGFVSPLYTTTTSPQYAVGPYDFATIYNSLPLWQGSPPIDGTGQTIAVAERSDICTTGSPDFGASKPCGRRDDIQNFRSYFGLSANLPGGGLPVVVMLNGVNPGIIEPTSSDTGAPDDEREAILDAEIAGGVAKNAQVLVVVSQTTEATDGALLSAQFAVDNDVAPVLSVSFLSCEANLGTSGALTYDLLWEQAAAEGITVAVSAGDTGSAGCDSKTASSASKGLAVNGIASTPFNVAVGGTDFNDTGKQTSYWSVAGANSPTTLESALGYIPEIPWNNSCGAGGLTGCSTASSSSSLLNVLAGGGGQSNCALVTNTYCLKPSWQSGLAVTGVGITDGVRDIPDVALFASSGSSSDSSYVICISDANSKDAPCPLFYFDGGTSASAPAFAGIMAMVNQYVSAQGQLGRQGNANYTLYALASEQVKAGTKCDSASVAPGNACVFYDVTTGDNSVPCQGGSLNCSSTTNGSLGVLVDVNGQLAWPASPGYDLATGLGSINAANLVHNWPSVGQTLTATTVSLQLCAQTPQVCVSGGNSSSISIVHGAQISINVVVSPSSGVTAVPSGVVTLVGAPGGPGGSSAYGNDVFNLLNGSLNATVTSMIGGTYQIRANYPGDGTFAPSESLAVNVTVSPEPSSTQINLWSTLSSPPALLNNGANLQYGTPTLINVSILPGNSNSSPSGGATGIVSVTDGGSPYGSGTFAISSGGIADVEAGIGANQMLQIGNHSFQAAYKGDSNYTASQTSTSSNITIVPASTTIAVASSNSVAAAGTSVLLTGTVTTTSAGMAPTGSVTFMANGIAISGTPTYTSKAGMEPEVGHGYVAAQLSATLSYLVSSAAVITASYSGDNNYVSSSGTASTVITAAPLLLSSPNTSMSTAVIISSPGQSGTSPITVNLAASTPSATIICVISPTVSSNAPTCDFSPNNSLTGTGMITLTLHTTAATMASGSTGLPNGRATWYRVLYAFLCPAILLTLRRRQRALLRFAYSALCLLLLMTVGCTTTPNPTSKSGTPSGVYSVTVASFVPTGAQPITVYFNVE